MARLVGTVAGAEIAFASLGLLLGLVIAPNAAPGMINLVYLPLAFLGGMWLPVEALPVWMQHLAHLAPSYYFSRLALHAMGFPTGVSTALCWGVLGLYTVVFLGVAAAIFQRSEARA